MQNLCHDKSKDMALISRSYATTNFYLPFKSLWSDGFSQFVFILLIQNHNCFIEFILVFYDKNVVLGVYFRKKSFYNMHDSSETPLSKYNNSTAYLSRFDKLKCDDHHYSGPFYSHIKVKVHLIPIYFNLLCQIRRFMYTFYGIHPILRFIIKYIGILFE